MSRRPQRNHLPAFKAKVALAAIKAERTIAQFADQFDVHLNQITACKAQLEGSAAGLARSTEYYLPRPVLAADLELMRRSTGCILSFPSRGRGCCAVF